VFGSDNLVLRPSAPGVRRDRMTLVGTTMTSVRCKLDGQPRTSLIRPPQEPRVRSGSTGQRLRNDTRAIAATAAA
jgi:hypothetical protein